MEMAARNPWNVLDLITGLAQYVVNALCIAEIKERGYPANGCCFSLYVFRVFVLFQHGGELDKVSV